MRTKRTHELFGVRLYFVCDRDSNSISTRASECEDKIHLSSREQKSNAKCRSCSSVCHILHISCTEMNKTLVHFSAENHQAHEGNREAVTDANEKQEKCTFIRWNIQNTRLEKFPMFFLCFSVALILLAFCCVNYFLSLLMWLLRVQTHTYTPHRHTYPLTNCCVDSRRWLISFLFCHFDRFFLLVFVSVIAAMNTHRNGVAAVRAMYYCFRTECFRSLPFRTPFAEWFRWVFHIG